MYKVCPTFLISLECYSLQMFKCFCCCFMRCHSMTIHVFNWYVIVFWQFMECFIMGRDLVRLLQNVARIPEMDLLWRDLLHNPQTLSPQFTGVCVWGNFYSNSKDCVCVTEVLLLPCLAAGILQLLTSRTSRKFLACRLTPDMETKLLFMTSRVNTQTLIPDTETTICLWLESQTLLPSLAAGSVWPAEALSGLVSATVSIHSWEPITALWPHSLYMWCGSSI